MRLGGWSRLGIVISVLYGAAVFLIAYGSRPRAEHLYSAWLSDASEVIAKAISEKEGKEVRAREVARVNEKHKALVASLPEKQRKHWLLAFAWWGGGILLLFCAGWTVGWVYRGFRQHAP